MAIQSISISGRLTLDMHSLNNEGAEGNQLQTRMVHIVDGNGELAVVNAISGDMLKHIQAEHLHNIAKDLELPLCAGCRRFDANRINVDPAFFEHIGEIKDTEKIISELVQWCAMDDLEGVLITVGGRSTPRKSVVEFSWMVGIPEKTRTESYFHVKFDPKRDAGSGNETGANTGQNIFYRPASSGQYAVVLNAELNRVGFNDVSREHVLIKEDRKIRQRALLESILYTFIKPAGAMRNTQYPHILNFEGAVTYSTTSIPAPTVSALNDEYISELEGITGNLNRLSHDAIKMISFKSQSEFTKVMADLIEIVDKGE